MISLQQFKSCAILTNRAMFASSGVPLVVELLTNEVQIKKIFTPEHGFTAKGADGVAQMNGIEATTGLPLISLYGTHFAPTDEALHDIDTVLIALPNIGCRFYTYWWTITHMLESCAVHGKKVVMLDYPNLSQRPKQAMEGPMLDEVQCSSFLGRWRMPLTYAYTYAELLQWFVKDRVLNLEFEIFSSTHFSVDSTKAFVATSPAITDLQALRIYPFTGLFEGLNLSSGRGTVSPFCVLGAPWINATELHNALLDWNLPGITATVCTFRPESSIYNGEECHGLKIHLEDLQQFRPVFAGIRMMNYLSQQYPDHLREQTYPTSANPTGINHLDRLLGVKDAFAMFCNGEYLSDENIEHYTNVQDWVSEVDCILRKNY